MIGADKLTESAGHQFGACASKLFGFICERRSDASRVTMRLVMRADLRPEPNLGVPSQAGLSALLTQRNQTTQGSLPTTAVTAA